MKESNGTFTQKKMKNMPPIILGKDIFNNYIE
jgi:hypothetical protein